MTTDYLYRRSEHRIDSFTLPPLGIVSALAKAAKNFASEVYRRWRIRSDREVLMSMPDRMLEDIGIPRSEIDCALRYGREVDRIKAKVELLS